MVGKWHYITTHVIRLVCMLCSHTLRRELNCELLANTRLMVVWWYHIIAHHTIYYSYVICGVVVGQLHAHRWSRIA